MRPVPRSQEGSDPAGRLLPTGRVHPEHQAELEGLDIVVKPDRSYLWKDTAEMEELVAQGIYTQAESDRLYEVGQEVFALVESGAPPFDDEWIAFQPGPEIASRGIPELPAGWQFLPLADSEWGRLHASVEAAKRGDTNRPQ